jgi:hypothetical protein
VETLTDVLTAVGLTVAELSATESAAGMVVGLAASAVAQGSATKPIAKTAARCPKRVLFMTRILKRPRLIAY